MYSKVVNTCTYVLLWLMTVKMGITKHKWKTLLTLNIRLKVLTKPKQEQLDKQNYTPIYINFFTKVIKIRQSYSIYQKMRICFEIKMIIWYRPKQNRSYGGSHSYLIPTFKKQLWANFMNLTALSIFQTVLLASTWMVQLFGALKVKDHKIYIIRT